MVERRWWMWQRGGGEWRGEDDEWQREEERVSKRRWISKVLGNKFWKLCGNHMEGTKSGRIVFLKANCGGSKCHILKEHYGVYENVVLYRKL